MTAPNFLIVSGVEDPAYPGALLNAAEGMSLAFSRSGTKVWATGHVVDIGDYGVVIGHLFTRSQPSRRVFKLTPDEIFRIHGSSGSSLIRDFWGGYVAVVEATDGQVEIIRDPSGAIPVYWRSDGRRVYLATEMGRAPFSREDGLRVDADLLTAHLFQPRHGGPETCIAGVRVLIPGHAMRLGAGAPSTHVLWSPWDHATEDADPRDYDPEHFRSTVLDTIGALGSCFHSVLIGASGGLDSSVVGAGLASSSARICGHTIVGEDADSDERAYAERVVTAFGMAWQIDHFSLEDIDIAAPVVSHVPVPFTAHYAQAIAAARDRAMGVRPIDAFFSGNGGDNVFCLMRSATPLVDRLVTWSSPSAIVRTTFDIAHLTGADIGTILRLALSRLSKSGGSVHGSGDATFLDPRGLKRALDALVTHPWLAPPGAVRPGKLSHVRMIARAQGNDGFHSRRTHPPSIAPLLAQPIVELCLGIPSWAWISGGVDRSVARRAFRGTLPNAVLDRRSKGGPSGFMDQIYRRHERYVRESLEAGALRELGVLDPAWPSTAPSINDESDPVAPRRLLSLVAAEHWARSWM